MMGKGGLGGRGKGSATLGGFPSSFLRILLADDDRTLVTLLLNARVPDIVQLLCRPSKHKHLYNIYTMLVHRRRRWADVV